MNGVCGFELHIDHSDGLDAMLGNGMAREVRGGNFIYSYHNSFYDYIHAVWNAELIIISNTSLYVPSMPMV